MERDLTKGNIAAGIVLFSLPLMAGNLLQQFYNVADTWIVGRYLGKDALGAVGSSYTLMTFITSVILGLCMGSGAAASVFYGEKSEKRLRECVFRAFAGISVISVLLCVASYVFCDGILSLLRVPASVVPTMKDYLLIVFAGIVPVFFYNFFSSFLRAIGNSATPLVFLSVAACMNVGLDFLFVAGLGAGVKGAAFATVIAQSFSGVGIAVFFFLKYKNMIPRKEDLAKDPLVVSSVGRLSVMTCLQQSIMNLGILAVQGLVNSFGTVIMAAFAAAVKIDSFAYMPVQDFGNGFSTFTAQNYGAGEKERIAKGVLAATALATVFCVIVSVIVCVFARPLMTIFVDPSETEVIAAGVSYLRTEGACYVGIGILFLLYGYFRAVNKPVVSLVLTLLSLGTRVLLAYVLSALPQFGVNGIWISVPIGWGIADLVGIVLLLSGIAGRKKEERGRI